MGYEPLPIQQVGFGVGFAMAMFWPAYVAAVVVGLLAVWRWRRPRLGGLLIASALLPVLLVLFVKFGVDYRWEVGPTDGPILYALDKIAYLMLAAPLLLVLYGFVAAMSPIARRMRRSAHA